MNDLDFTAHEQRFGTTTFERGTQYFHEGRVGYVCWSEGASTLSASVRGNRATPYSASVSLAVEHGRMVAVDYGQCNCPVVFNCKHVVAVLLQAHKDSRDSSGGAPLTSAEHWATALSPLLRERKGPDTRRAPELTVGLELELELPDNDSNAVRLLARPVHSHASGAWTRKDISWSTLPYSPDPVVERRIDLLRELHSLHLMRSHGRAADSFYRSLPNSIDLADVSGRLLWDLLSDLADYELPLVGQSGSLPWPRKAQFELDITGTHGLQVEGRITVDGALVPADQRRFLGDDGSGIIHWANDARDGGRIHRFGLARLIKPIPRDLRRVASTASPIDIPMEDRVTFAASYLPALQRSSAIVSSDGTYTPPTISEPELHIVLTFVTEDSMHVSARWRYYVDDTELDFPADSRDVTTEVRDGPAESNLLRTVLSLLGLPADQRTAFHPFTLAGTTAALFVTERLSLLDGYDNVHVDRSGNVPDFHNVSESVRIAVSTTSVRGENDWFDLGVVLSIDGTDIEFATVLTAIARGDHHVLLGDGRFFSLDRPSFHTLRTLVEEARSLQDTPDGPLRISRYQVSLWEELAELGEVSRQARAWREQVAALSTLGSITAPTPPTDFDAELRPYQLDGYSWLHFLWRSGLGGILADDMGLGKTIQTLAMIAKVKEDGPLPAPFVIVAPTSVVHNWAREAARFAPGLTVATALGTRSRRRTTIAEMAAGADIVVTSYTVFRLDFEDFDAVPWSGLILDEAQYVKNHKSKSYHCARRLSAPFKLAITGTPMENNVMELWALLSITSPGLFPSASKFTNAYRHPIEKKGDSVTLATLRRRIRPLVLRRTKEVVAQDLPAKQEQMVEVQLNPRHRRIYETRLARERQKVLGLLHDFERNRVVILQSLTILRQLSLDVALVEPQHDDVPSAKIEELVSQLKEVIDGGHRALVFSQFTRFLGRIRDRLETEGITLAYLDGATHNRSDVVERFRTGAASVFLISLKAGGVGLTLTEADYCFVLDPWWNPATEAQAVDRAHRIGQTRTVFVHRYIARGTIEEKGLFRKWSAGEGAVNPAGGVVSLR
ncbi:SNF2-related protein [Rhodococcus sp. G-MC3]|nr:SNF2-related protein [Rhodococcus sp. G-MC3]